MDDDLPALPAVFNQYKPLRNLGCGVYGQVVEVRHAPTGKLFAMKIMPCYNGSVEPSSLREVSLLRLLRGHDHVVASHEVHHHMHGVYLIIERGEQDLTALLHAAQGPLPLSLQKSYARQLLAGLHHCHARMVAHRDLKPANLLLFGQNRGRLKICDFGMARTVETPARASTRDVITLNYRGPELLLDSEAVVSTTMDMWSAGAIIAELSVGRPFFEGTTEVAVIMAIFRQLGLPAASSITELPYYKGQPWPNFPERQLAVKGLPAEALNLVAQLLCYDVDDRLTAEEALQDAYFGSFDPAGAPDAP
ncbi:Cyclin-dependent kinase 1 [Diplonema papillatum]|nr:Cyclin-dependent kinase 1 [Diplonema papillatum]